jgi:hypothetical protein
MENVHVLTGINNNNETVTLEVDCTRDDRWECDICLFLEKVGHAAIMLK